MSLYPPNNIAHISAHVISSDLPSDCHLHWLLILFRPKLQTLTETGYLLSETIYSTNIRTFLLRTSVGTDASEGLAHANYCPPSMWCSAKTRLRVYVDPNSFLFIADR